MRRIHVVGTSCAGKTTFSRQLAELIGVPHIELDDLHFDPNWVEVPTDVFRDRVSAAVAGDGWVVDGNYGVVRDVFWPRVDTLVWLDYPFLLILWRSVCRTARRVFTGERCCNGNRESLLRALSRDSILLWVVRSHGPKRRKYLDLLPEQSARGVEVVILRSPEEAKAWLGAERAEHRFARPDHTPPADSPSCISMRKPFNPKG